MTGDVKTRQVLCNETRGHRETTDPWTQLVIATMLALTLQHYNTTPPTNSIWECSEKEQKDIEKVGKYLLWALSSVRDYK